MSNENNCPKCSGPTYLELDDRRYCEAGNPRKQPIRKCLGCGFSLQNCTCNDSK